MTVLPVRSRKYVWIHAHVPGTMYFSTVYTTIAKYCPEELANKSIVGKVGIVVFWRRKHVSV